MRISYFIHGRGRGHATRTMGVIPVLQNAGHEITVFAGGMASDYLNTHEHVKIKTVKPGFIGLKTLVERLWTDREKIKHALPDLIISDGDAPAIFVARMLSIPSISVGHGIIIPYFKHTIKLPKIQFWVESLNVLFSSALASRKIATHFSPLQSKSKKVTIAFPDCYQSKRPTNHGFILTYFRDNNGHHVIQHLISMGLEVRNFGQPVAGAENHVYNVELFHQEFDRCLAVVASAGSNLVSEVLFNQKPMLALYRKGDLEQMMNAQYLAENPGYKACQMEQVDEAMIRDFLAHTQLVQQENPSRKALPSFSAVLLETTKRYNKNQKI